MFRSVTRAQRRVTASILKYMSGMFNFEKIQFGKACLGSTQPTAFRPNKVCSALALAMLFVFGSPAQAEKFTGLTPVSPQPTAEQVRPGLAVDYLFEKFYSLSDLYEASVAPQKGEPIPYLNALTETDPATREDKILNVLTTDQDMMVGAFIRGLINFSEVGDYVLHLVSNDGVRFWIGGEQIWEDPEIHFDRESDPLELKIETPGWYELKIDYYQKKGTHALQLLWTPPGGEKSVVPPEALGHLE